MTHDNFVKAIVSTVDQLGRVKSRERNDLEYKESFGSNSFAKYAKTMAAFSNNHGGYLLFGIKDSPREIKGVNSAFSDFKQEVFTDLLNSLFSPEIIWETGTVEFDSFSIGYIYTFESVSKPIIALKNETGNKISSGDVFYRYRARSEKIKYPEMSRIIEDRAKRDREHILKLVETIRKSDTTNLGIVNYQNGHFSTPFGADVAVDKRLVLQVLKKAKYIKSGSFDEANGQPVLKVTGNIDLAEEVPVPDVEPDIQYPYLQKTLAKKLKIETKDLYALIWRYKMKDLKKFHIGFSPSSKQTIHKFSDIALQFLAEKINENKNDTEWLPKIYRDFLERNKTLENSTNG